VPGYSYQITDSETGEVLHEFLLRRPVGRRNTVTIRRVSVPESLTVAGAARNPENQADATLAAYHRQECKQGSRFKSRFKPDAIKQAWKENSR
jgi:hypothetical protein